MAIVQSKIESVKVYRAGATVYRAIEVRGQEGRLPELVEVPELPLALHDGTVRVRVEGEGDVIATDVRVGLYAPPRPEVTRTPDELRLRAVRRKISETELSLAHAEMESALYSRLAIPDRPQPKEGKPPPPAPIAGRLALEEMVDAGVKSRLEAISGARKALADLRREEADLEDLVRRAGNARRAELGELTKIAVVRLRQGSEKIEQVRLVLEYFVPGARWAPAYQCRLSRDCLSAEVNLRALIAQRTGEDWRGVKLILSTAAPMTWTELPELQAIRLGRAQAEPSRRPAFRAPPTGAAVLFADLDRGSSESRKLLAAPQPYNRAIASVEPLGLRMDAEAAVAVLSAAGSFGSGAGAGMSAYGGEPSTGSVVYAQAPEPMMAEVADMADDDAEERAMPAPKMAARRAPAPPPAAAPAPAPMRSMAAGPQSMKKRAKEMAKRDEGESEKMAAYDALESSPDGEAVELAESMLFTDLVLPAPSDGGRGKLRRVDQRTTYLASLSSRGIAVSGDPIAAVENARRLAAAVEYAPLPPMAVAAGQTEARFDFAYEADAPVDVASDGAFHSVALGVRKAGANVRYVVVPREDTNVYRVVLLENPLDAPILPGPAEIYVGGDYVLTTQLPTVVPRGEQELGLGVEPAIKCARNTRFREERSGDKIVATSELWHEIEIDLANNLPREIAIEVRERIPQPKPGAEVVIEESGVSPPWSRYTQEERGQILAGGRRWSVSVAPGARKKLQASYVVKIYAQNQIAGGNRREA